LCEWDETSLIAKWTQDALANVTGQRIFHSTQELIDELAKVRQQGFSVVDEEFEIGVATEFYLDRPPMPLFQPRMPPKDLCKATQIYDGDYELFDFNAEVKPMLNVLIEKTLD
jgi:hypothetical protein